jgi:hypothetical protein
MSVRETILKNLLPSDLEKKFDELIGCLPPFEEQELKKAKTWFDEKVESITTIVNDIVIDGDEQELIFQLSTIWLQMRLEWNLYNLQMQYQTMTLGQAKAWLMIKGSCLSYLVEMVEFSIDSYRVFWLSKLATDPIQAVSNRIELVDRMLSITQSTDRELQLVTNDIIQIRDYVSGLITSEDTLKQFHTYMESLLEKTSTLIQFTTGDFKNCIESSLIKGFSKESLRFVLNHNVSGEAFYLRPEISQVLLEVTSQWIRNLVQASLEESVDARVAMNKSQHVNISWTIEKKDGKIYFSLCDDGAGKNPFELNLNQHRSLQMEGRVQNTKGEGSRIEISMCATPINLYCISNVDDNKRIKVAFEADEILSVESHYKSITHAFGHPCVVSEANEMYILINLSETFQQPELKKSTFVFLKTKEPKSGFPICLQLCSVEGFTHASLASGGALTHSPYSKGFFIYRQEVITVLDSIIIVQNLKNQIQEAAA